MAPYPFTTLLISCDVRGRRRHVDPLDLMRDAIRRNQTQSDAIRRNQTSSVDPLDLDT